MIYLKISEDFFHKHLDCMVEYGQLNVYLAEFIRPRNDKNKKKTDLRQQLPTKSVSFEIRCYLSDYDNHENHNKTPATSVMKQ